MAKKKRRQPYPTQKQIAKLTRTVLVSLNENLSYASSYLERIGATFKSDFIFHKEKEKIAKVLEQISKECLKRDREKQGGITKAGTQRKAKLREVHFKWKKLTKGSALRLLKQFGMRRTKTFKRSDEYYKITMDTYPFNEDYWESPILEELIGYDWETYGDFGRILSRKPTIILVGVSKSSGQLEQDASKMLFLPRKTTTPSERILRKLGNVQQLLDEGEILKAIELFKDIDIQPFQNDPRFPEIESFNIIVRDTIEEKKRDFLSKEPVLS